MLLSVNDALEHARAQHDQELAALLSEHQLTESEFYDALYVFDENRENSEPC